MNDEVTVVLEEKKDLLWRTFHSHTTEMVVTKTGRKIFPKLEYSIKGLEENTSYALAIQIEQVDNHRYKFSNGEWTFSGRADSEIESKKVWHEDAVMSGKHWMNNSISFDRVKITNNQNDKSASQIYLHSMHKYIPVLSIYKSPSDSQFLMPQQSLQLVKKCRIPYTEFIAVTAYQNQSIVRLKVDHNPFAKGFREGSPKDRKRKSPGIDDSADDSSSQVSSPQPSKPEKRMKLSTSPHPSSSSASPTNLRTVPPHSIASIHNINPMGVFANSFNPLLLSYPPLYFSQIAALAAAANSSNFAQAGIPLFPHFQFPTQQFLTEADIRKEKYHENQFNDSKPDTKNNSC